MLLIRVRDQNYLTPMHVCAICVELLAIFLGIVLDTYGVPIYILLSLPSLSPQGVATIAHLSMFKLDSLCIYDTTSKEIKCRQIVFMAMCMGIT